MLRRAAALSFVKLYFRVHAVGINVLSLHGELCVNFSLLPLLSKPDSSKVKISYIKECQGTHYKYCTAVSTHIKLCAGILIGQIESDIVR